MLCKHLRSRGFVAKALAAGTVAVSMMALSASALGSGGGTITCTQTIPLPSGTVDANVFVPADGRCENNGQEVTGNVIVEGILVSVSGVYGKNLEVHGGSITLQGDTISGNVSVTGINAATDDAFSITIGGNFNYENNLLGDLRLFNSTVAGNVNVHNNFVRRLILLGNLVGQNLNCSNNSPPPVNLGVINMAAHETGECAGV